MKYILHIKFIILFPTKESPPIYKQNMYSILIP